MNRGKKGRFEIVCERLPADMIHRYAVLPFDLYAFWFVPSCCDNPRTSAEWMLENGCSDNALCADRIMDNPRSSFYCVCLVASLV